MNFYPKNGIIIQVGNMDRQQVVKRISKVKNDGKK